MNDQSKDFVLTGGYHVDDFYKYVCDTECIRQNKYTKDEMDTLSIDQRLQTQGINWRKINSAGEFSDFFGLAYLKENPIFLDMTKTDFIFCLLSGVIGALTSARLREPFGKFHNGDFRKNDNEWLWKIQKWLEHPGDLMDKEIGPLAHRVKYGHDIFNLKEVLKCIVDKKDYFIDDGNPAIKATIKAVGGYIRHIYIADPFSLQGLPLPGSSVFRQQIIEIANKHQELYQQFFTLKHRDLTGATLVSVFTKVYKTAMGIDNKCYKYYEINIVAQVFCLIMGLFMNYMSPSLKNSLNYYSLAKISVDLFRVNTLSEQTRKRLFIDTNKRLNELKEIVNTYNLEQNNIHLLLGE